MTVLCVLAGARSFILGSAHINTAPLQCSVPLAFRQTLKIKELFVFKWAICPALRYWLNVFGFENWLYVTGLHLWIPLLPENACLSCTFFFLFSFLSFHFCQFVSKGHHYFKISWCFRQKTKYWVRLDPLIGGLNTGWFYNGCMSRGICISLIARDVHWL